MRNIFKVLFFLISIFSFGIGCQAQKTPLFPTSTPLLTSTSTITPNTKTAITATPIPSPTVTFPAPLVYHETLTTDVEARFGFGELGHPVLSPNGNYLAVTSGVGIILFHPETLREVKILPQQGDRFGSIAWSPDSKKLAVVTSSENITIWEVEKAKSIQELTALDVTYLSWSPNGEKLAVADGNKVVNILDLQSTKFIQSFREHAATLNKWGRIIDIQWINDNEIISADDSAQIFLWGIKTGKVTYTWEKADNVSARRIALSPDKEILAITSMQSQQILLWDLVSQREQKIIENMPPIITEMSWSPNGQIIALATLFPSKLIFVDINSKTIQKEFSTNAYSVNNLSWFKDGEHLIAMNGHGDGDAITIWNIQTGQGVYGIRSFSASRIAWSSNSKTIATSDGKVIVLWDIQSGNSRLLPGEIRNGVLDGSPNYVSIFRMAFNPSGNLLAAELGDDSSVVRVWDITTGSLVDNAWVGQHLDDLSWLSDTQLIAPTSGNEIYIWEPGNWETHQTIETGSFHADNLDISSDGKLIAIAQGNTIEIRKLENGEIFHTWKVDFEPRFGLDWSPDKTKIALIGTEEMAIYEVTSGKKLGTLKLDESGFSGLKWSPDSNTIVYLTWTPTVPLTSLSETSGTAKIYMCHVNGTGAVLVNTQKNLYIYPENLSFSPNGKYLALALWQKGLIILRLENY